MATKERHVGRLIDHIGLVVRDLAASKTFYSAVFGVLKIPIGGSDEHNFWADELFIGSPDSDEVQGELTGRHHIAFQAQDRAMVAAGARVRARHLRGLRADARSLSHFRTPIVSQYSRGTQIPRSVGKLSWKAMKSRCSSARFASSRLAASDLVGP